MPEIIANPVAHLHKLEPKLSPKKQAMAKEQKRIQKRVARFEAQRAQEELVATTAAPPANGMQMMDMPDSKPAQRRLERKPIPQSAGQSMVNRSAVQRVQAPPVAQAEPQSDIMQELQAEFGQGAQAAALGTDTAEPSSPQGSDSAPQTLDLDDDAENIANILKRFKGSPDEIAKQIAKSYSHAEKRVRKLEQEKTLLMNPQAQPVQSTQPAPVLAPQQSQVVPSFNYKRFKDDILDKGDEVAQEFEGHIAKTMDQKLAQLVGPVYDELVDNRMFRKHGDVVTEENLPVIRAMAQREPGDNLLQKMESAIAKYRQAMPSLVKKENKDVQEMQAAVQTPAPTARRSSTQKMWKASDLRKQMQRPEYRYDPTLRTMIDRAYAEGRVLRDQ